MFVKGNRMWQNHYSIIFPYVPLARNGNRQNHIIFAKRFIECVKFQPLPELGERACWSPENRDYCWIKKSERIAWKKAILLKRGFRILMLYTSWSLFNVHPTLNQNSRGGKNAAFYEGKLRFCLCQIKGRARAEPHFPLFITSADVHKHSAFTRLSPPLPTPDGLLDAKLLRVVISIFKATLQLKWLLLFWQNVISCPFFAYHSTVYDIASRLCCITSQEKNVNCCLFKWYS